MGKMRKWEGDRVERGRGCRVWAGLPRAFVPMGGALPNKSSEREARIRKDASEARDPAALLPFQQQHSAARVPLGALHSPPGPLSPSLSTPHAANP